jgi:hypothetical protein
VFGADPEAMILRFFHVEHAWGKTLTFYDATSGTETLAAWPEAPVLVIGTQSFTATLSARDSTDNADATWTLTDEQRAEIPDDATGWVLLEGVPILEGPVAWT